MKNILSDLIWWVIFYVISYNNQCSSNHDTRIILIEWKLDVLRKTKTTKINYLYDYNLIMPHLVISIIFLHFGSYFHA